MHRQLAIYGTQPLELINDCGIIANSFSSPGTEFKLVLFEKNMSHYCAYASTPVSSQ
jgi:hypothetical protein